MIRAADPKWNEISRWAAIAGDWDIAEARLCYKPPAAPAPPFAHGLVVCDEKFRDGVVRATIRYEGESIPHDGSAGIVLGYHSETGGYIVIGLGGFDAAYFICEFLPAMGWVARRTAGTVRNLRVNQPYELKVAQRGQRIAVAVDDVPVLEHLLPAPPVGNQLGVFAESATLFENVAVQRRAPTAFVAMQFGEPYDTLYRSVIRPKAEQVGFEVLRIDEMNGPGIIFQDIQRKIEDAKVVIAEITAPNQNVYYEVGYAHALHKPTILLAERGRELPFDIRSYRVIFYDDSIAGKPQVERTLREHLNSILQEI